MGYSKSGILQYMGILHYTGIRHYLGTQNGGSVGEAGSVACRKPEVTGYNSRWSIKDV